MGEIRVSDI